MVDFKWSFFTKKYGNKRTSWLNYFDRNVFQRFIFSMATALFLKIFVIIFSTGEEKSLKKSLYLYIECQTNISF